MRNPNDHSGMETATSMFLLIISAGLIFGALSFIQEGEGHDEDIVYLRNYQARGLGNSLIAFLQSSGAGMPDPVIYDEIVLVWDGHGVRTSFDGSFHPLSGLSSVLAATPDGLASVLIVHTGEYVTDTPGGEFVSWSHRDGDGRVFLLYLSMHDGSMEMGGRSL
ncbi:MAG: hypothetical protein JW939_09730 [Candidatus Thermoplasmatota archaeon]|nr:hypothetical protein [Candidatus Thermoplasmatota archaeon]